MLESQHVKKVLASLCGLLQMGEQPADGLSGREKIRSNEEECTYLLLPLFLQTLTIRERNRGVAQCSKLFCEAVGRLWVPRDI